MDDCCDRDDATLLTDGVIPGVAVVNVTVNVESGTGAEDKLDWDDICENELGSLVEDDNAGKPEVAVGDKEGSDDVVCLGLVVEIAARDVHEFVTEP